MQKLRHLAVLSGSAAAVFSAICVVKGNERFYSEMLMPRIVHRFIPPEDAHKLAIWAAKNGLLFPGPSADIEQEKVLSSNVFGISFPNCIGLAAGFDKNAEAIQGEAKIGFGFIEVGSVTPKPQPGNEKPRVFRLQGNKGIINRYGFNSDGQDKVLHNIMSFKEKDNGRETIILGVNLGKNKLSEDPIEDYVIGVKTFGSHANYLVVNVSSPNTPGLRSLQSLQPLKSLITAVLRERDQICNSKSGHKLPILLKVSPDLEDQDKMDIAKVVLELKVDGLIVSNTTVTRPVNLQDSAKSEVGGLSGEPLKDLSTKTIADFYRLTQGKIPIIGVGGVFSGRDAFEKICAGASLIQIYSSLIYEGPPVVNKIKRELAQELSANGFKNVKDAIGTKKNQT